MVIYLLTVVINIILITVAVRDLFRGDYLQDSFLDYLCIVMLLFLMGLVLMGVNAFLT